MAAPKIPVKTREFQNHSMDSEVWNGFPFRPDDIFIATYSKSGTTWVQQIVGQLTQNANPDVAPGLISPWVDTRFVPKEAMHGMLEAQTHRRFMKTHSPLDALVWSPDAKYIFVGRDGRDMIWSLHHHFARATPLFWQLLNDTPGRVGPPYQAPTSPDPRDMLVDLAEDDTRASLPWPFWSHTRQWWEARDQPNLLLVHFNDMMKDLDGEMRRIAEFLGEGKMVGGDKWDEAVEHCTFRWMKEHAEQVSPPQAAVVWEGGAQTFVNKGTNGRWADVLSAEDNEKYLAKARAELGEEGARWLEKGRLG
ncbi:P-loop containing nucleoside triphosphate hydrolase protein [Microdochium trichocladiopsis]|uniref:P-loop containing nucleoside triphosphate hydrolase protein n=1 Tax=Microdochium trichocladiopsis TaxID=1682393 RepID=A0A9P8XYA2_9PEZI|nr:P-loop containing nucleoside triphosphate hydrolase protein [Microdochium trichocladiopsis]KAH7025007.1 P-loop containing nucleoside triphosphate hydrolase protein [Microdochium trichocladiopsis]